MVPEEIEKLRRDMEMLRESIGAGWGKLSGRPLGSAERWEIRRFITACQDDLAILLDRLKEPREPDA